MSERKRPGRKPLVAGQTTEAMGIRLPRDVHDELCRLALLEGVSVGTLVRRAVLRAFRPAISCSKSLSA
jgi:hypothetical protein